MNLVGDIVISKHIDNMYELAVCRQPIDDPIAFQNITSFNPLYNIQDHKQYRLYIEYIINSKIKLNYDTRFEYYSQNVDEVKDSIFKVCDLLVKLCTLKDSISKVYENQPITGITTKDKKLIDIYTQKINNINKELRLYLKENDLLLEVVDLSLTGSFNYKLSDNMYGERIYNY